MPFDGFVTKCVSEELNIILAGGRIDKIHQPERDEIHLLIRNNNQNYRLLISSNATSPRVHLTSGSKENPDKAPMFCMILRKHIGGGRVKFIEARELERVVNIGLESANELGDISPKTLVIEIMGRRSNIILLNADGRIIDSLVHVDQDMSSVREVMPARQYCPPPPQDKIVLCHQGGIGAIIGRVTADRNEQPMKKVGAALLDAIMGASPLFCRELCRKAGVGEMSPLGLLGVEDMEALREALMMILNNINDEKYAPCIVLRDPAPFVEGGGGNRREAAVEGGGGESSGSGSVSVLPLERGDARGLLDFYCWEIFSTGAGLLRCNTMSGAVDEFYRERARAASLAQRKAWLVKLVNGNIARCRKKLTIQQESIRDASDYDKYKLYGELLTANIYNISPGEKSARLMNYYAESGDEYIEIALDGDISPQANAQAYFKKYRKAANTLKHAQIQAVESANEIEYLESVLQELDIIQNSKEIDEIRQELASQKYISNQRGNRGARKNAGWTNMRKNEAISAPGSYVSTDGLTILVGKNNRQNDMLTMKTAASNDIWLHARGIPGSHVIIKKQQGDVPFNTLHEAAMLAAHFSKAAMGENIGVDYTVAKHVRKPSGAKPGMVIYGHQRTLFVTPDASLPSRLSGQNKILS